MFLGAMGREMAEEPCTTLGQTRQPFRFREISTYIRQSGPDSIPGLTLPVLETFRGVPSSLGSGSLDRLRPESQPYSSPGPYDEFPDF